MEEIAMLVELVMVKQPAAGAEQRLSVAAVPALNSAVVPISIAVAPLRLLPLIVTELPPPAAPLVGDRLVTIGAEGVVPAGALDDMAGPASLDDATTLLAVWIKDEVTLLPVTIALTVMVPLVKG